MAKKDEPQLSRRERQIMEIVYRKGNATAAEVHAGHGRPADLLGGAGAAAGAGSQGAPAPPPGRPTLRLLAYRAARPRPALGAAARGRHLLRRLGDAMRSPPCSTSNRPASTTTSWSASPRSLPRPSRRGSDMNAANFAPSPPRVAPRLGLEGGRPARPRRRRRPALRRRNPAVRHLLLSSALLGALLMPVAERLPAAWRYRCRRRSRSWWRG